MLVILATLLMSVAGHGWMRDPQPRSGGGAGSGNASTGGPCGRNGPTTPVKEVEAGSQLTLGYSRVNNHGQTGQTVSFKMVMDNDNPTQAQFNGADAYDLTGANLATMDTTTRDLQTHTVQLPAGVTGKATIQFHWRPTSGGNWYDCAYVTLAAPAVTICNTANPCDVNAECTPNPANPQGDATCKCNVNYFGDGTTCEELPAPTDAYVWFEGPTTEGKQDLITNAIATFTGAGTARVIFDDWESENATSHKAIIAVSAHPESGEEGVEDLKTLRLAISEEDPALSSSFGPTGLLPKAIQVVGLDDEPVMLGDPLPSANVGVIVAVVLVAIVLFGLFAFGVQKYRSNHGMV